MTTTLQSQIFYEIALAIGSKNKLNEMLQDVLPVLVRKLTCRAGVIYQRDAQAGWSQCISVPRRVKGLSAVELVYKHLISGTSLPAVLRLDGQEIYLNEIPSFGAIALIKSGLPLSDEIRFSLPQLYNKLAQACHSSIQSEKVRKSEALYRALVNTSRDAILMTDLKGQITFASPTATDVYGWGVEELTGATFEQSLDLTIDKKTLASGFEKMRLAQPGSLPPYRILGKKKETRWLDHSWNVVADGGEADRLIHFVRDITTKVNNELQHSAMLKVVPAAIYYRRLNKAGQAFFISDQVEEIIGYKPEEMVSQPTFFQDRLHPEDRDWVLETQQKFNPQNNRANESITYRMIHKKGHTVWILNHVHTVRLRDGTPEYVCGVLMDITDSKMTEQTLALEEKKRERLQRLLSPAIAQEVISGNISMEKGGELRETTILFTDIRGFTAMSELNSPQMIVNILNDYFERMIEILFKHGGTLDKFVGDEIMALFGAPVARSDDPLRAVRTALEMKEALGHFNVERIDAGLLPIQIGMGINTGECVAGYLGSSQALDYTVIGDSVNVASRLCSVANEEEIIISKATYQKVKEHVMVEPLSPVKVKGKAEPLENYLVVGLKNN